MIIILGLILIVIGTNLHDPMLITVSCFKTYIISQQEAAALRKKKTAEEKKSGGWFSGWFGSSNKKKKKAEEQPGMPSICILTMSICLFYLQLYHLDLFCITLTVKCLA